MATQSGGNPLLDDVRLPTVTISLVTGGEYYPEGTFAAGIDPNELEVRPYSMSEESSMRDPFRIMSGTAYRNFLIKTVPGLIHPEVLKHVDVDMIMIASRMISHGNDLKLDIDCDKLDLIDKKADPKVFPEGCVGKNSSIVKLDNILTQFVPITPIEQWQVDIYGQTVQVAPASNAFVLESIKTIGSLQTEVDMGREVAVEKMSDATVDYALKYLVDCIEWVKTRDGVVVRDKKAIREWAEMIPSDWLKPATAKINDLNNTVMDYSQVQYGCACGARNSKVSVVADPVRFFGGTSPE